MASIVNLPKQVIEFKAKKKFEIEDDKHESSIKRGDTFYLQQKDKDYFLFDPEGSKFAKFKITRAKYKELSSSHTSVSSPLNTKTRTASVRKPIIKTTKNSAADIRRRRPAAKVISKGLEDQINFYTENASDLAYMEGLPDVGRINHIIDLISEYEEAGVVLNVHASNFISEVRDYLLKFNTLKEGRPRFVFLKNVLRTLKTKYRISLDADIDVIEVLQKRTTSFNQPRINYDRSPANI